jgi:hypothetical protein
VRRRLQGFKIASRIILSTDLAFRGLDLPVGYNAIGLLLLRAHAGFVDDHFPVSNWAVIRAIAL